MEKMPYLQAGDTINSASDNILGDAIRFLTQGLFEPPSISNHSSIVSVGGPWSEAKIIEADIHAREIPICKRYWPGCPTKFSIYRLRDLNLDLMLEDIERLRREDVGDLYPFWQLFAVGFDRWIGKLYGGKPNILSWTLGISQTRFCSALVAKALLRQGERFGRPRPAMVDPDDIADRHAKGGRWLCIRPWGTAPK